MPVPIRLTFDATTDVAYLELQPTGPVDVLGPALLIETDRAFAGHIIADFTLADGRLVGFELQHASACLPADLLMAAELALGSTTARAIFEALQVVLGGATALLGLRAARSWAGVLAAGLATYLVVLFAGYWASLDYLAAVAPILCWSSTILPASDRAGRCCPATRSAAWKRGWTSAGPSARWQSSDHGGGGGRSAKDGLETGWIGMALAQEDRPHQRVLRAPPRRIAPSVSAFHTCRRRRARQGSFDLGPVAESSRSDRGVCAIKADTARSHDGGHELRDRLDR